MHQGYILGASELFTVFFVMVGPLEHLMPFVRTTKNMTVDQIQKLSVSSFLIVVPVMTVMGLFGRQLLHEWKIPIPVLQLTAGIVFFIMALKLLIGKPEVAAVEVAKSDDPQIDPLTMALRVIINPYACGTLIVLLASSHEFERTLLILTMLIANLFLDCLALRYVRILMGKAGQIVMRILGAVLGIMQAALAVTIIYLTLKMMTSAV
ncbi:MarC family protein [Bdellovibrio sp. HCB290]|uniref:MarC family protein n=1 Tax=Bdellovibrio sp. HCB290 TaxID=3394356 RepID=UPI0039B3AF77